MQKFGIILNDGQQIGAWKALEGSHMELNFEDDALAKIITETEAGNEVGIQLMMDPESIDV